MKTRAVAAALLCGSLLAAGCGRYNMEELRGQMVSGEYAEAAENLQKDLKLELPDLLELGLTAHYAGDFQVSNNAFQIAESVSEDLYTRRLSNEAAALATNDTVRPYAGSKMERLLIHYYRAMNYVRERSPDAALIEMRRGMRLAQYYADENGGYGYEAAPFLAYLSGILHEWAGETNDAYIAYRNAEQFYNAYAAAEGVKTPPDVGQRLTLLARRLGFKDEAERYEQLYGPPPTPKDGWGELIVIYESGFAPRKKEMNIFIPILKDDDYDDESRRSRHSETMRRYSRDILAGREIPYDSARLDYLLRAALPRMEATAPTFTGLSVQAAGQTASSVLAEDINEAAQRVFRSEMPGILLRALLRGALKHKTHESAKKQGAGAKIASQLFNIFSESADTRSWQTLPARIGVARMHLPAGEHDVNLLFSGNNMENDYMRPFGGNQRTLRGIAVQPNRPTVVNIRTYE